MEVCLIVLGRLGSIRGLLAGAYHYDLLEHPRHTDHVKLFIEDLFNRPTQLISEDLVILLIHVHLLQPVTLHDLIVNELVVKLNGRLFSFYHSEKDVNPLDIVRDGCFGVAEGAPTEEGELVKETLFYLMKLRLIGEALDFHEEGVEEQSVPSNQEDVHAHQPFPEVVELSIDIICELRIIELLVVLIQAVPDLIHCNDCT